METLTFDGQQKDEKARNKAEYLLEDNINLLFARYGRERQPSPIDTPTARIMWDLWQLYAQGAPYKDVEDLVHLFCVIYGAPVREAHGFVFGKDSIYGPLDL